MILNNLTFEPGRILWQYKHTDETSTHPRHYTELNSSDL